MSAPKILPSGSPYSTTTAGKSPVRAGDPVAREKVRLKKATEDFEAFFMTQMIGSMRQTVPQDESADEGAQSGMGKEVFQSLFDQELGRKMASGSRDGIGDLLYKALEKTLIQQMGVPETNQNKNRSVVEEKTDAHALPVMINVSLRNK